MTDPTPESGRELDAKVAEEVMGLRVVADDWPCQEPSVMNQACEYHASQYQHGPGDPDYVYLPEGERFSGPWPPSDNGYSDVKPVPFYSTEIDQAWAVVHRMHWESYSFACLQSPAHDCFYVIFKVDKHMPTVDDLWEGGNGVFVSPGGVDAPEAICRAALKAVRADTEG